MCATRYVRLIAALLPTVWLAACGDKTEPTITPPEATDDGKTCVSRPDIVVETVTDVEALKSNMGDYDATVSTQPFIHNTDVAALRKRIGEPVVATTLSSGSWLFLKDVPHVKSRQVYSMDTERPDSDSLRSLQNYTGRLLLFDKDDGAHILTVDSGNILRLDGATVEFKKMDGCPVLIITIDENSD
ncbi:MAG: hypothetical protein KGY81_09055, partial [Phycisphaerae bacterium]|jgi:hypothetical protein|nr:hypothetical protein [Phycisphaerae bacterium]